MPQVDKVTLYHIAVSTAYIYVLGYMYCTLSTFYTFLNMRKVRIKYKTLVYHQARVRQRVIFTITNFP